MYFCEFQAVKFSQSREIHRCTRKRQGCTRNRHTSGRGSPPDRSIRLCACGTLRTADWYNERLNLCGGARLYSTFIWQRVNQWQWFPSLVSILHLPELRFASQLLLEPPVIPTTKQNNTEKRFDFSRGGVFVQCDKSENTKLSILIKYVLNSSAY